MNKINQLIISLLTFSFLSGCAAMHPLKAPCNYSGSHCSPRIKINQWNNNS